MKPIITIAISLITLASCTAVKVAVPEQFSTQATAMKVKGINGWKFNEQLSFGTYVTSSVKRGWDFSNGSRFSRFSLKPEDILLSGFNIHSDREKYNEKNRFQYSIQDASLVTEVLAQESFSENQIVYKSNIAWLNEIKRTDKYQYAFSATIVPLNFNKGEVWTLTMVNEFDAKTTKQKLFERPQTKDIGFVTNGTEKIEIKPLMLSKHVNASGKEGKLVGGPILTGYELRWDDGLVGVVDILDHKIWIVNDLDPKEKMVLSAVASAILLKRKQDVYSEWSNG